MGPETKLYTIYDKKSGTWDKPFAARTHGEAERMFAQVLNGGDSLLSQYPDDFSLWFVGKYDSTTGIIQGEKHQLIGEGAQFLRPASERNQ